MSSEQARDPVSRDELAGLSLSASADLDAVGRFCAAAACARSIAAADRALYRAKSDGRDRVVV